MHSERTYRFLESVDKEHIPLKPVYARNIKLSPTHFHYFHHYAGALKRTILTFYGLIMMMIMP